MEHSLDVLSMILLNDCELNLGSISSRTFKFNTMLRHQRPPIPPEI